jgi:hypothetical protein
MKLIRDGIWCFPGGLLCFFLGMSMSGFGPCGAQHPALFLAALAGLGATVLGALMLALCVAAVRKFRKPA